MFLFFSEGTEEETKAQALFQAYIFLKNLLKVLSSEIDPAEIRLIR
jgi:hypothetical protein